MLKRIATLCAVSLLASAVIADAGPYPCNLCDLSDIPQCVGCGSGTGGTECGFDVVYGCQISGTACAMPTCPPGSGGGGGGGGHDPCPGPEEYPPCPIEIQGVIVTPEAGGSVGRGLGGRSEQIVSGVGGRSFQEVLVRVQEARGLTSPPRLGGWSYAVAREHFRGGLVTEDGSGYVLSARRTPAGTHVTVYSASNGRPDRPISRGILSPDEVLVLDASVRGRSQLIIIGARAGSGGPEGSNLQGRQLDFLSALAALPQPQGGTMRTLSASEAAGIPD